MVKFYIFKVASGDCKIEDFTQMEMDSPGIFLAANRDVNPEDTIISLSESSSSLSMANLQELEYIKLGELELTDSSLLAWNNIYINIFESIVTCTMILDKAYVELEQELYNIANLSISNALKPVRNASKIIKLKTGHVMNATFFNFVNVLKKEFKVIRY